MKHVPPPGGTSEGVLQLLIANLDYSDYLGRLGIGRIFSGTREGGRPGGDRQARRVDAADEDHQALLVRRPAARRRRTARRAARSWPSPASRASPSARPITSAENPSPLPALRIDEPTHLDDLLRQHLALRRPRRQVGDLAEHQGPAGEGAARRTSPCASSRRGGADSFTVAGPRRAAARDPDRDHAPRGLRAVRSRTPRSSPRSRTACARSRWSCSSSTCPRPTWASCSRRWRMRKGKMAKMVNHGSGRVRLEFQVPTRGLIGIRTELMTDTRGTAVMNALLEGFDGLAGRDPAPHDGRAGGRPHGRHHGLHAVAHGGARRAVRGRRRRGLRGHDRGRELASGRHGRQRDQGQEAHEHARLHRRRGHPPDAAPRS